MKYFRHKILLDRKNMAISINQSQSGRVAFIPRGLVGKLRIVFLSENSVEDLASLDCGCGGDLLMLIKCQEIKLKGYKLYTTHG